jgi:hypothetical protein
MAQKKSHSSAATEEDVIVLLVKIEKQDIQLREYATDIVKVRNEYA